MNRIGGDLRDHYWFDELVQETISALEDYLALWASLDAALGDPPASR